MTIAAHKYHSDCQSILPKEPFRNIALTFSGGGYRAASFSLGALSYLYRVNYEKYHCRLISNVKFITSTSGGSLTNGKFVCDLYSNPQFSFPDFFSEMRNCLDGEVLLKKVFEILQDDRQWREIGHKTNKDGRTEEVRKTRNLINAFAKAYNEILFKGGTLDTICSSLCKPSLEKVSFNTTEFNNGLNFYFQANGHLKSIDTRGNGYIKINNPEIFRLIKISDIVAASSCFPSGFEPIIYPQDFINENLKNVSKMLNALSLDHNNPGKIDSIRNEPISLMDGGISDNMGIHCVMIEDNIRINANPNEYFDLILACDVTSYFVEPLKQAKSTNHGLTAKINLMHVLFPFILAPIIFFLSIFSIVTKTWENTGYLVLIPSFFITCIIAIIFVYLYKARNSNSGTIKKTIVSNLRYFLKIPLSSLINMVQARIRSSILLVSDLFLKQIRRGQYDSVFTKPRLINRCISCLIYEFSTAHEKRRLNILNSKDAGWWKEMENELVPGEKIRKVTDEAKSMGTTLWFDENDVKSLKRDKIIAVGQFTMCYNLIKHICRLEILDPRYKHEKDLQKLKSDLLQDWKKFKNDPLFMLSNLDTS